MQGQVRKGKKKFDKLKVDVMQKIDLLSASRCNLLSSTLAAYQQALLKFWENTSRTMTQVAEQFKGLPTYQFQMLKSLNPLACDNIEKEKEEEGKETRADNESEVDGKDSAQKASKDDDDDQLISLDHSPFEEKPSTSSSEKSDSNDEPALLETDLLGDEELASRKNDKDNEQSPFVDDLLGNHDLPPLNKQSGK